MCKATVLAVMKMEGKFKSKGFGDSLMSTNGFLLDPWHSTPVKKHTDEGSMARWTAKSTSNNSASQQSSLSVMQGSRIQISDLEMTTIQKQRMELQLLVAELKDRDQELNSMAAAHHRQLQVWEQDRQRVLTLKQRCARLDDELQKRNEVIRAIIKRLKMAEVREQDSLRELSSIQQRIQELSQRQQHSRQHHQDMEEKNRSLNSSILTLSSQLGQFQVHEEELSSMLKLKDKDLTEATNHILGLTDRLRESEFSLKECQSRESKMSQEAEEYKRRFREAKCQNAQLKDELQEKTLENNSQKEELIRLRQENQLLRKQLALTDEGESWKDELLALARSKQERTESELLCLRQVCEHQQNDLQLLKLNLESSREALMQYESQRSLVSDESVAGASCALEHCNHQETEMGASVGESYSNSLVVSKQRENLTIAATISEEYTPVQNICCAVEKQVQICNTPVSGSDGPSAELAPTLLHCCDCSNVQACCSAGTELDFIAVIDYSTDTEDQVLLVDINPNDPQSSCPGDVTCVYVDCSTPLPQRTTTNPGLVEDTALSKQQQEAFTSSTCRLQRLLAESQQMVASLELSSGKPLSCPQSTPNHSASPVLSSTSHSNSSNCILNDGHNNTESHDQFQSPNNNQDETRDGSQIHSIGNSQETVEYGQ
ncbi:coiled-coil domain-containing protein 62 isoform X1 [Ictalurus punctatus]|uniref:Coiled-coil domain-containing protein 62 isoform X1 n=1 Tax=Ictalurus punctatus TaxID=7998 RepID=A0A2D0SMX9_ICTPU|nr:coiled-coil domain-containing protein 62 isoform X1 [Ictalurus punctatus]XP_017344063.1 coiled-coil domain-containing protein 62 isoform X1 [Ictalurus punctatus]